MQVIMGYSGSVTVTEGKTETVGNTVGTTAVMTLKTPGRQNCSLNGTLNTYTQASGGTCFLPSSVRHVCLILCLNVVLQGKHPPAVEVNHL